MKLNKSLILAVLCTIQILLADNGFSKTSEDYFAEGVTYQTQQKYEQALKAYFNATKINPDYVDALNNIGQVYMSQRKLDNAITYFQKTITLNKNFSVGYYNLACAYSLKKEKQNSLKYLSKAIKMDESLIENAKNDQDFAFVKNDQVFYKIVNGEDIDSDLNKPEEEVKIVKKPETIFVPVIPKEEPVDIDTMIPKTNTVDRDSIAIIIGNKDYINKDIPPVDFAINDAQIMKEYVKNVLGFKDENIAFLPNADQTAFNTWFGTDSSPYGKLSGWIKPGGKSKVFIYYSGHGAPDLKSKTGYFVPVNAEPSVIDLSGYSLKTFYSNLGKLNTAGITVVIDACFSGSSSGGMLIKNASPVFIKTTTEIPDKITVFSSSAGDQISSWYPPKKHSLFTYYFLKGIMLKGKADEDGDSADSNGDGKLNYDELFSYINNKVGYMAKRMFNREQNPELINSDKGVFIKY